MTTSPTSPVPCPTCHLADGQSHLPIVRVVGNGRAVDVDLVLTMHAGRPAATIARCGPAVLTTAREVAARYAACRHRAVAVERRRRPEDITWPTRTEQTLATLASEADHLVAWVRR